MPSLAYARDIPLDSDNVKEKHRLRQGGNRGNVPPPKWEKCCRKMALFQKALFLATTIPKIDKNSISLLNFYQKISKISQNFPKLCVCRPNARKINAGFVSFFEKHPKRMHFRNFLKKFFEIFQKYLKMSQQFVFFVQTCENLTQGLLNFLKNRLK